MVSLLWVKQEFTSGIRVYVSKMAVKTLKMTNTPDAPTHQQLMKTWKKRKKWLWMVNKEYYLQVQCRLREAIQKKRPDLWKNDSWLLHHDNAPAHTSLLVREFLAKNNTVTMPQPPYSPDMAPCDFFLFPKIKRTLKGRRFTAIDDIKAHRWKN